MNIEMYLDSTYLTLLDDKTQEQQAITQLCQEAIEHHLRSVCVRPQWVTLAKQLLANSKVKVATVIGFPQQKVTLQQHRNSPSIGVVPVAEKLAEIQQALADGADELDIVLNTSIYGLPHDMLAEAVTVECELLVDAAGEHLIKLILECDVLGEQKLSDVVNAALGTGVGCVKTSTGFVTDGLGATLERVRVMADCCKNYPAAMVKASGGVRCYADAEAVIKAGALIIGTSNAVAIVQQSQGFTPTVTGSHTY